MPSEDASAFTHVLPFVAGDNAFTPAELDVIVALGDQLVLDKASLQGREEAEDFKSIRITRTGWLEQGPDTNWIYERIARVAQTLNEQVYQFDLRGFSENFQYTVYEDAEGGHYDWHIDQGMHKAPRKLSLSLQLSAPDSYEGCDLEFRAGNQVMQAPRTRGALIAFPSYVLHRVTPIVSGTRKSLVVWIVGPKFK